MTGQYYQRATCHLQNARQAVSAMRSLWAAVLDNDPVTEFVQVAANGSGAITALMEWPRGSQRELTEHFRACVRELRACLDELVVESVESLSVLRRVRRPEHPRFFPIADSQESFDALLAESCMDGVLATQVAIVNDCQPYQNGDDESVGELRGGLRLLLGWDTALRAGALVEAWATPVDPQVRAQAPATVARIDAAAAGVLGDEEHVLAWFQLQSYTAECSVSALAGTYVDLCFVPGFDPIDPQDTFDRRLTSTLRAVARFAAVFAHLLDKAPGSRRVLTADAGPEHGAGTWIQATDSSRSWSQGQLAVLAESPTGIGRVLDTDTLTLIVHTAGGVFERVIPHATPLRKHERPGVAAEQAVQDAAATWGLPDFVIAPTVERAGSKIREISDGLLVVGKYGIVVQAKAREREPRAADRESSWARKQIIAAGNQIGGTVRRLKTGGAQMVNGRGRSVYIDGPAIEWAGVVIIDHPAPPDNVAVPAADGRVPIVALLRRDWEFLFNQLRSTYAVVQYLHRVGTSTTLLGGEPARYYELAAADAAAPPGPLDPAWIRNGGEQHSVPVLPTAPAGSDNDQAHAMVRIIMEDIANSPASPEYPEPWPEILAHVDSVPIGFRTSLGQFLIDGLATTASAEPDTVAWRMRRFGGDIPNRQLGFAICNVLTEETRDAFRAWVLLRHHEGGEHVDIDGLTSVGVLLTPRHDGVRDWDTTTMLISGDPELTDEELRDYRALWNTPNNPAAPHL